jgi:hypothetical protein
MNFHRLLYFLSIVILFSACKNEGKPGPNLFSLLPPEQTGIHFENTVSDSDTLNILDYLYYYNGGGVAIGDINNDGTG